MVTIFFVNVDVPFNGLSKVRCVSTLVPAEIQAPDLKFSADYLVKTALWSPQCRLCTTEYYKVFRLQ